MAILTREQLDKIKKGVDKYYDPFEIPAIITDDFIIEHNLPFNIKDIHEEESFIEYLYKLMDKHGIEKDPDLYKKAGLSSDKWSKYKNNNVIPKKEIVIAFAVVLNLTIAESNELLGRASYAFSKGSKRDCVIRECIKYRFYDFQAINEALYDNGLEPFEI